MQFERDHPIPRCNSTYSNTSSIATSTSTAASIMQSSLIGSPQSLKSKWQKTERGWLPTKQLLVQLSQQQQQQQQQQPHEDESISSSYNNHYDSDFGTGKIEFNNTNTGKSDNDVMLFRKPRRASISDMTTKSISHKNNNHNTNNKKDLIKTKSSDYVSTTRKSLLSKETKSFDNNNERTNKMDSIFDKISSLKKKNVIASSNKSYQKWEFGKEKHYICPLDTPQNNYAATMITKQMRSWYQQLKYKIALIQYKIKTVDVRIDTIIDTIQKNSYNEKVRINRKINEMKQKTDQQLCQSKLILKESEQMIQTLRKENSILRKKNQKLGKQIIELKMKNEKLESLQYNDNNNNKSISNMTNELEQFTDQIEQTHDQLSTVIPKYEESIQKVQDAVHIRHQYYMCEKTIRIHYMKLLTNVVCMLQNDYVSRDPMFVHDLENIVFELIDNNTSSNIEEDVVAPTIVVDHNKTDNQEEDSISSYDDYNTIATYEE